MIIPPLYFSEWLSQWQRFPWLPVMSERHFAVFEGGDAGNSFLQTTRIDETPNTVHTLTVAVGVRDNPATFGGVRLDILANGRVVATASYTKQGLDGIKGSDVTGLFSDVSLAYETGPSVVANQPLAIRISKIGGAGTVLDFDHVRFTTTGSDYFDRSSRPDEGADPDGLSNGVEYFPGLKPKLSVARPR